MNQSLDNKEMKNNDSEIKIDIYSPFFELLSEKEIFFQIFSIIIRLDLILLINYIN